MPKTVFAIALAFALGSGAAAADITPYAAPPRETFWQGPYVGANLGYQWGLATHTANKPSGVVGGLQSGYNWQIGSFVFGGETDLQFSDAEDRFAGWKFSNSGSAHCVRAQALRRATCCSTEPWVSPMEP